MKLYTRLIDSGAFIFWSSDEGNTYYILKIRILNGEDKIELVNLDINKGQNYYSFDRVGSGDYEVELNGYIDGSLYQTETKKIKIISSVQKSEEQVDKLLAYISNIYDELLSIESGTSNIVSLLEDLHNDVYRILKAQTDPYTIVENRRKLDEYYEKFVY